MPDVKRITLTVSHRALTSKAALDAFGLAQYRLSHNARYHKWSQEKRLAYCLTKAFEAALKEATPDV